MWTITSSNYKKDIASELETALSIITTAYLRNEDIITSIEENIHYLNVPVKTVFEEFLSRIKLSNPDIVAAMHDVGMIYDRGIAEDENAKTLAEEYYCKAYNGFLSLESYGGKLLPYIQYRLGKMLNAGKGTEKDCEKAFAYFEKSAISGNKYAQFSLGSMYRLGTGVELSYENAYLWYEKSAQQGNPYACYETAKLLRDGKGIEKNISDSGRYFRLAYEGFQKLVSDVADDKLLYRLGSMTTTMLQNLERHNHSAVNNAVLSMLFSFGRLISDDYERKSRTRFVSERKLKDAIRRKKEALGLKDDHTVEQQY